MFKKMFGGGHKSSKSMDDRKRGRKQSKKGKDKQDSFSNSDLQPSFLPSAMGAGTSDLDGRRAFNVSAPAAPMSYPGQSIVSSHATKPSSRRSVILPYAAAIDRIVKKLSATSGVPSSAVVVQLSEADMHFALRMAGDRDSRRYLAQELLRSAAAVQGAHSADAQILLPRLHAEQLERIMAAILTSVHEDARSSLDGDGGSAQITELSHVYDAHVCLLVHEICSLYCVGAGTDVVPSCVGATPLLLDATLGISRHPVWHTDPSSSDMSSQLPSQAQSPSSSSPPSSSPSPFWCLSLFIALDQDEGEDHDERKGAKNGASSSSSPPQPVYLLPRLKVCVCACVCVSVSVSVSGECV